MVKKIDFTKILLDNVRTFKNNVDDSWSVVDCLVFLVFPFVLAALIQFSKYTLHESFVTAIITAASIFAGLLLNLLVLIYTIFVSGNTGVHSGITPDRLRVWKKLIKQTFANVSFCILISIIIVALCLLFYLGWVPWLRDIVSFTLYFCCTTLILHLFMVLKRIHALIDFDIS